MELVIGDGGGNERWTRGLISETMSRDRHPEAVPQGD